MTGVLSGMIGSMKGATAPKTAPTSLSATPVNTSVSIAFTAPSDDGGSAITNYEYSFNNSTWTALSPADAATPVTVSGLTQNTAYTIYLRAVNIVGSGPASSVLSFTTQGVPTSAPTTLSAIPVDTSVAISFTAAASSTALTNYEYSFNNSTWTALSPADSVSPVTVSGLTQNTAYTVYLRGVNSYGVGPGSTGVSFTTQGVPTGTATITSVPVGTTTATVNFTVAAGGGAITGYDLYVANQTNAWNNTTASPISVTGLSPNTTYTFYVRAKNSYGVGPQSAGFNATTNKVAPSTVEVLVVGGGGAGSRVAAVFGTTGAGGSGSGGTKNTSLAVTAGSALTVTVGGGGTTSTTTGTAGGTSTFNGVSNVGANPGGADGGAPIAGVGGTYTGGRGGRGGVATSGSGDPGGAGWFDSINGASHQKGGGGGGASRSGTAGAGGAGGGGGGGRGSANAVAGTANTGGGGGGGNTGLSGGGGSGVVIIAYPQTFLAATATTGSPTYSSVSRSGYHVYTFTGTGSITF